MPAPTPTNTRRVALVTGAASGIGHAVAAALLARGDRVGGLDRDPAGVPAGCEPLEADLRDGDAVRAAVDGFAGGGGRLDRPGRIDLLVGNAGVAFVGTVEDGDEADWARLFDVNVSGQMRTVRAALPWLRESPDASIVLMGSCSATDGIPERAAYSASKGAVHSLSRALAVDLLPEGIRVNCVSPGTVRTPFMDRIIADAADPVATKTAFDARQPIGRMIEPAEVAAAVLALADAGGVTGQTLSVDGGMATLRPARSCGGRSAAGDDAG